MERLTQKSTAYKVPAAEAAGQKWGVKKFRVRPQMLDRLFCLNFLDNLGRFLTDDG